MKKVLIFALLGLLSCTERTSVGPDTLTACGVTNPAENLPWLKEMIEKAEADRKTKAFKGNYIGQIYQTTWRGQDAFWSNFMLGSGGIYARIFDCHGQWIKINSGALAPHEIEELNAALNRDKLIYTNTPL